MIKKLLYKLFGIVDYDIKPETRLINSTVLNIDELKETLRAGRRGMFEKAKYSIHSNMKDMDMSDKNQGIQYREGYCWKATREALHPNGLKFILIEEQAQFRREGITNARWTFAKTDTIIVEFDGKIMYNKNTWCPDVTIETANMICAEANKLAMAYQIEQDEFRKEAIARENKRKAKIENKLKESLN